MSAARPSRPRIKSVDSRILPVGGRDITVHTLSDGRTVVTLWSLAGGDVAERLALRERYAGRLVRFRRADGSVCEGLPLAVVPAAYAGRVTGEDLEDHGGHAA